MKYTILWVVYGATNTLHTDEFDTLVDFISLLPPDQKALVVIVVDGESKKLEELWNDT